MAETLSPTQSAALFDILTHYDTYAEIRDFRYPGSLKNYGPPFTVEGDDPSTAPALQTLVHRFLLTLPGLRDLPDCFWKKQCYEIIEDLEKANLSESYDKGVIGSRKTLATAISALIEYPVRGTFGGFAQLHDQKPDYDVTKAEDLGRGFRDFMNDAIYGNAVEELVDKVAETDQLDDHTAMTKALHEFVLVNLASLMHYTLILSPKGQYLLKLVDNANKLVPYLVLKQTLKIGNVATMMSGLVKIGLAKVSMTSVTNWIGLTQSEDEGMNLLQTIISTVLGWDTKELESRASKIEHAKPKPAKELCQILKDYAEKPQPEQERIRKQSQTKSISIVTAILKDAEYSQPELSDAQHKHALDYLSIQLSIRDRKQLIQCFCHRTPDHLTQSVRQLVDAYEPVIRRMHNAIDLSGTLGDFEYWLKDTIKLARIHNDRSGKPVVPTVGDFVQLLRKHQRSCHVFMHQCCKNDPELTGWYLAWTQQAASQFRRQKQDTARDRDGDSNSNTDAPAPAPARGAGKLNEKLAALFTSLPTDTQTRILPILDAHAAFLDEMHAQSAARLSAVLTSPPSKNPAIAKIFSVSASYPPSRSSSPAPPISRSRTPKPDDALRELKDAETSHVPLHLQARDQDAGDAPTVAASAGPGAFLARWQALLDATPITPLTAKGSTETAGSAEVVRQSASDVDGTKLVQLSAKVATGDGIRVESGSSNESGVEIDARKRQRQLRVVVEALAPEFRRLLATEGKDW